MWGGGGLGETVTETDTKIQGRVSHTLLAPISMPFPIYVVAYSKREWPPLVPPPMSLGSPYTHRDRDSDTVADDTGAAASTMRVRT